MRRSTAFRRVSCLVAAWLAVLSAQAAEMVLRDDRGVRVTFAAAPQRIVSLLPSLTESVCALGGCERLVGVDRFSNWPAQVNALPRLGGLDDAQVERIAALRPDVVLAAPSTRVIDRLEALGLKVFVVDTKTHDDVKRNLGQLGTLLGRRAEAARAWAHVEQALGEAAARVPAAVRGRRVYVEVDPTPYAAGAASFIGETLRRLHMGNVVGPALGAFPRLNPEFVVTSQPDIIVAARHHLDEMPRRPGWASLRALQRRQTCGFGLAEYDLLVRPGPRMGEGALLLADCLVAIGKAGP